MPNYKSFNRKELIIANDAILRQNAQTQLSLYLRLPQFPDICYLKLRIFSIFTKTPTSKKKYP